MSILMISDWVLFFKTLLVKIWPIAMALVLVTLVSLWINGSNSF